MKYTPTVYASAFLGALGDKGVTQKIAGNFLRLVRRNGDLPKLSEILRNIEKLFYKKKGIIKVEVMTARDMKKELESKLRERFGKKADINFVVKPEVVGGIVIKVDDEIVVDASVKRRLDKLFVNN